jgi:hypothetical protein
MHLESIVVRHYRLHRECRVDFDAARTLIGGPNESGKSTLIEAAHRALFLRATTGGEARRSMVSLRHGGHPEVELHFAARGRRWRMLKRFSGPSGTATLTEDGGASWSGDEAEEKLSELLGVELIAGRRVVEQWAHLWIRQGFALGDPTVHATAQRDELLARLQSEGGAAAVQSDIDRRVAGAVAREHAELFRDNGEPRAGSALATAQEEEEAASGALAAARMGCERLERAANDFASADSAIAEAQQARKQVEPQQREVEEKLARVAALRGDEQMQSAAASAAADKCADAEKADAQLRRLRAESEQLARALAPLEEEMTRSAQAEADRRRSDAEAEAAWQQASEAVRAARQRTELAAAHLQRIERTAACERLAQRREQVRALETEVTALEAALAQTPPVTAKKLSALQKLESQLAQATAARDAMATGLELLATDAPVRLGGRVLTAGDTQILTEDTELTIGGKVRLRLRPGGGSSLAEAREQVRTASDALRAELDRLGLASVEAAATAQARRQQIESALKTKSAQLAAHGAETIEKELAAAEQERTAAEAGVQRRTALGADFAAPASLDAARARQSECAQQLAESGRCESLAAAERKAAASQLREASARLEAQRQSVQERKHEATRVGAQLQLLTEKHGEDDPRGQRLVALSAERTTTQTVLTTTRAALATLQPELLERDRARLARAIEQHTAAQNAAGQRRAHAGGELQRDGATDPQAELALAEARHRAAVEQRECAQRQAGAVALLHELFLAEQRALAEQFTRPLAARISAYLECLFGPGARAEVTLEADAFTGLRLIRPTPGHGAFAFDELSGGTREQLAAAMRLALAEVLAEAHDGSLPVVFDDAFAYSDPERVQTLQRMLDIAAMRGLQVIVLSCNPADYAALGAKAITLRVEPTA